MKYLVNGIINTTLAIAHLIWALHLPAWDDDPDEWDEVCLRCR